ncbi:hypothetical protein CERSUDRAFT_120924 [Gelatoporia subvermispora B]|uniref:WW domain-containing protein n=1 Tax=Ceriporiopsis subvermispora (strain B) TaxID=914234 RepID=M2RUG5_CERS8|nr:hypothetical protein CERSUDRAFT_120924 [Gelatoporia subvermispora B]
MEETRQSIIDFVPCSGPINQSMQLLHRQPDAGILVCPASATQSLRYDSGSTVRTELLTIHGGTHSSAWALKSSTNPGQWKMCINPEGSPYYVTTSHPFSIVTDSVIQEGGTQEKLNKGIHHIMAQIEDMSFPMPRNAELYIRFDKATGGCKYYFVDHDAQTEFWLQDVEMASIGMPEVSSVYHTSEGHLHFYHTE